MPQPLIVRPLDDLTAPQVAITLIESHYREIDTMCQKLGALTHTVSGLDEDGRPYKTIVMHPDFYKWMDMKRKILIDMAKINAVMEVKRTDQRISAAKVIYDNIDKLPKEVQQAIIKAQMREDAL